MNNARRLVVRIYIYILTIIFLFVDIRFQENINKKIKTVIIIDYTRGGKKKTGKNE